MIEIYREKIKLRKLVYKKEVQLVEVDGGKKKKKKNLHVTALAIIPVFTLKVL